MMALRELVPAAWRGVLAVELESLRFAALERFVEAEYASQRIYPRREHLFRALALAPPESIKVVILGQDPYHGHGQAHGLCFSVPPLTQFPPSLRNIFKELEADLGQPPPLSGDLEAWARQGVLLLNTVLTVREGAAHSHAGHGWEEFTDAVIRAVGLQSTPIVFMLWGAPAQSKKPLIETGRHIILEAPHPSPLSAYRGFLGCRHFSKANAALAAAGRPTIDWRL
jgi:uracil-DNA glycosylase